MLFGKRILSKPKWGAQAAVIVGKAPLALCRYGTASITAGHAQALPVINFLQKKVLKLQMVIQNYVLITILRTVYCLFFSTQSSSTAGHET